MGASSSTVLTPGLTRYDSDQVNQRLDATNQVALVADDQGRKTAERIDAVALDLAHEVSKLRNEATQSLSESNSVIQCQAEARADGEARLASQIDLRSMRVSAS